MGRVSPGPGADLDRDEPSPGADVAGVSRSPSADVAGVSPSPSADVAEMSPLPLQMWQGVRPVPVQMQAGASPVPARMWQMQAARDLVLVFNLLEALLERKRLLFALLGPAEQRVLQRLPRCVSRPRIPASRGAWAALPEERTKGLPSAAHTESCRASGTAGDTA